MKIDQLHPSSSLSSPFLGARRHLTIYVALFTFKMISGDNSCLVIDEDRAGLLHGRSSQKLSS